MNAHTPTPWEQSHNVILSEAGTIVGDGFHLTPADTAHIVACVNAHDALTARVAELERALTRWQTFARDNGWTDADFHTGAVGWITETNAALAKGQV